MQPGNKLLQFPLALSGQVTDEGDTNRDKLNCFCIYIVFFFITMYCMRKVGSDVIFINKIRVSLGQ